MSGLYFQSIIGWTFFLLILAGAVWFAAQVYLTLQQGKRPIPPPLTHSPRPSESSHVELSPSPLPRKTLADDLYDPNALMPKLALPDLAISDLIQPGHRQMVRQLALASDTNNYQQALQQMDALQEHYGEDPEWMLARASTYIQTRQFAPAARLIKDLQARFPQSRHAQDAALLELATQLEFGDAFTEHLQQAVTPKTSITPKASASTVPAQPTPSALESKPPAPPETPSTPLRLPPSQSALPKEPMALTDSPPAPVVAKKQPLTVPKISEEMAASSMAFSSPSLLPSTPPPSSASPSSSFPSVTDSDHGTRPVAHSPSLDDIMAAFDFEIAAANSPAQQPLELPFQFSSLPLSMAVEEPEELEDTEEPEEELALDLALLAPPITAATPEADEDNDAFALLEAEFEQGFAQLSTSPKHRLLESSEEINTTTRQTTRPTSQPLPLRKKIPTLGGMELGLVSKLERILEEADRLRESGEHNNAQVLLQEIIELAPHSRYSMDAQMRMLGDQLFFDLQQSAERPTTEEE